MIPLYRLINKDCKARTLLKEKYGKFKTIKICCSIPIMLHPLLALSKSKNQGSVSMHHSLLPALIEAGAESWCTTTRMDSWVHQMDVATSELRHNYNSKSYLPHAHVQYQETHYYSITRLDSWPEYTGCDVPTWDDCQVWWWVFWYCVCAGVRWGFVVVLEWLCHFWWTLVMGPLWS